MVELGINSEKELSPVDLKKLQKELNCSAFCQTTITYIFNPEGSSVDGILHGSMKAKNSNATYHPTSETLKIIEPSSFTTLVSIRINRAVERPIGLVSRSMSADIIFLLEEHFNKPDSTQSK